MGLTIHNHCASGWFASQGSWPQVAAWREYRVDMTLVFAARKNVYCVRLYHWN